MWREIKKVYNKAQSTGQTKKQENQQGIHQKTSKRACRVLKKCKKEKKNFGQKKPRLFCTRMKGNTWRRRGTASHLSNMMLLCACGTGSLLVIDDVTAAKSRG